MNRFTFVIAAMLATALIAAGCGDDDETTSTSTTTAESATGASGASGAEGASSDWAQQADQVCAEGNKELDAEGQKFFGDSQQAPPKAEQEQFVEDVVIPNIEQQIEDVSALTPPEGQEDQVDEFLDSARSALDEAKADPALLTDQGGEDPFSETNQLASDLGLKVCSQG